MDKILGRKERLQEAPGWRRPSKYNNTATTMAIIVTSIKLGAHPLQFHTIQTIQPSSYKPTMQTSHTNQPYNQPYNPITQSNHTIQPYKPIIQFNHAFQLYNPTIQSNYITQPHNPTTQPSHTTQPYNQIIQPNHTTQSIQSNSSQPYDAMFIPTAAAIAYLAALAGAVRASPPDLTIFCDKTPEICTNICFAIRCAATRAPAALTFDAPSAAIKNARRSRGGCSRSSNRCGFGRTGPGHRKAPHESCHEYPFASTQEADTGAQLSRCVPPAETREHGVQIRQLESKWQGDNKTSFTFVLGNPGAPGVRYCTNDYCEKDKWEIQKGAVAKSMKKAPKFKLYLTRARMMLASLETLDIPTIFAREHHPEDVLHGDFKTWVEGDDEYGDTRYIEDMVLHELPWDYFWG